MFYTGPKPWWYGNSMQGDAIGIDLGDKPVMSAEALRAAGLDWQVAIRDSAVADGTNSDGTTRWKRVPGECFIVRDKDTSILGRCTTQYQPFQNIEAFSYLDRIVTDGDLLYHTAGSLEGGKRVWILAQTPESWTVKRKSGREDKHHAFINAMLDHGGSGSNTLSATDVNVVCANTQAMADSRAEAENLIFRIPHRGDMDAKYRLAIAALESIRYEVQERRAVLQELANAAMDTDEFIDFATSVFLDLEGDSEAIEEQVAKFYEDASPRSKTIMENKVADVTKRFQSGIGNEGVSMYDAVNAFTEYFDHFDLDHIKSKVERGRRAAKAVTSAWVGAGAKRKALVYKRLRERVKR
jgi:phage/plasmid-like protein (TIGR03299 family)